MDHNVPSDHIVIYTSETGITEHHDYPAFLSPMELGHDLVRIEMAPASADSPGAEVFGERVTFGDGPFLEFDFTVAAARQLAEALLREAEQAEHAPEVT